MVTANINENKSNNQVEINLLAESLEIKKIMTFFTAISYFRHFNHLSQLNNFNNEFCASKYVKNELLNDFLGWIEKKL